MRIRGGVAGNEVLWMAEHQMAWRTHAGHSQPPGEGAAVAGAWGADRWRAVRLAFLRVA